MEWKNIFDKTMQELTSVARDFPWENKEAYADWLSQTYYFVINSTRILALASARTPMDQYSLHNRFIDHAREERGHEILLVRDMAALKKEFHEFPEKASTAALYKTQYYWIEHKSTDAFMGWVVLLEAFAATSGPNILQRVNKAHGEKACFFWKVHAAEDQDHIEKAFKQIALIPNSQQQDTVMNFKHCANYYRSMLIECGSESSVSRKAS
jgi:hypothetical protein